MTLLLAGKLLAVATGSGPCSVTSCFHSSARVGSSVLHHGRSLQSSQTPWLKTLLQIHAVPAENELWAPTNSRPFCSPRTKPARLRSAQLPALGGCPSPARPAAAAPPPPSRLQPGAARARGGRCVCPRRRRGAQEEGRQEAGCRCVCGLQAVLLARESAAGPVRSRDSAGKGAWSGRRRRGGSGRRQHLGRYILSSGAKVGCRAVVPRDRGPPWDAGTRRSPSAVAAAPGPPAGNR